MMVRLKVIVTSGGVCARTGDAVTARAPATKLQTVTNPKPLFTVVSPSAGRLERALRGRRA